MFKLLKNLNYLEENSEGIIKVKVPVFYGFEDENILKPLSLFIMNGIFFMVEQMFDSAKKNLEEITPITHGVEIKEITIELWHSIIVHLL